MEMFTGRRDHISVLIFFISYFLSAFLYFFSLQSVPYYFFWFLFHLYFRLYAWWWKWWRIFKTVEYTKRSCILHRPVFCVIAFCSLIGNFFHRYFLAGFPALVRVYSIHVMWCCTGTGTNQNFASEVNYNISAVILFET